MDKLFKPVLIVLLAGILLTLIAIYTKLPAPALTYGEFKKTSGKQRNILKMNMPIIYVAGVDGYINIDSIVPLQVEVSNFSPLQVEVHNTPLEVEVR